MLAPITGGGRLRKDAAAAFMAMNAESERRYRVTLHPTVPQCAYRTLAWQHYYWNQFGSPRAAVPGTSNHGWGLAVDFPTEQMRHIVDEIGARYGWAKRWSDAPYEWWHIKWRPGVWHPSAARVRPVTAEDAIAVTQQLLRAHGFTEVPVDGKLTGTTVSALRSFQKLHRLPVSGKPDLRTRAALRSRPATAGPAGTRPSTRTQEPTMHRAERRPPSRRVRVRPAHAQAHHHAHAPARHPAHRHVEPPKLPDSRFPANRLVTAFGPLISIVAGAAAAWLGTHFPGLDISEDETAQAIAQAIHFAIGAGITHALQQKFLSGWQQWEQGVLDYHTAAATGAAPAAAGDDPFDPQEADPPDAGAEPPPPLDEFATVDPSGDFDPATDFGPPAAVDDQGQMSEPDPFTSDADWSFEPSDQSSGF